MIFDAISSILKFIWIIVFIKFLLGYPFVPMQKKSTTVNAYSPVHTTNKYLKKKKKKEAISFVFLKLYHVFLQNSFYFEISYCFVLKLSSF